MTQKEFDELKKEDDCTCDNHHPDREVMACAFCLSQKDENEDEGLVF